jgi:hypothetical protein
MAELRPYATQNYIEFALINYGETDYDDAPPSFEAGDVKIDKDGAGFTNAANLPTHKGQGTFRLLLSAAEHTAKQITGVVRDQTSPKSWEDQGFEIETYGHPSAMHPKIGIGETGTNTVTLTIQDANSNNVVGAIVEIWDEAGTTLLERKTTNSSGQTVHNLDDGTYTVKISKAGYTFDNEELVVDGTKTETYTGTGPTSSTKNLRYCEVVHNGTHYDVIVGLDNLDQINDVLQEWALANEDIGEALDLPVELIQNEDITTILKTKDIDCNVYIKA